MFKKKPKPQESTELVQPPAKKTRNWPRVSLFAGAAVVVIAVIALAGGIVLHQSNTNPQFCGLCHVMQSHVDSYMSGHTLDSVHAKAGVQCKDCHDYGIPAEIVSGVKFITGNYDKTMPRRKFSDEMCTKCHISLGYVAVKTDFLVRNPHLSHWPDLKCTTCHISHGEQVDYCSQCHENGGQRMTGAAIVPRAENPWANQE
jgi:hypothetical protein